MSKYVPKLDTCLHCDSCGCAIPDGLSTTILEPESNEEFFMCLACYNDAFGESEDGREERVYT